MLSSKMPWDVTDIGLITPKKNVEIVKDYVADYTSPTAITQVSDSLEGSKIQPTSSKEKSEYDIAKPKRVYIKGEIKK